MPVAKKIAQEIDKAKKHQQEWDDEIKRQKEEDNSPLASTLAAKHIINPGKDKLQEVSYLSIGIVHPLTMLQAYEKHLPEIIESVKEVRYWYLNRYIKRLKNTIDTESEEYQEGYQGEKDENGNPLDVTDYKEWMKSLPRLWTQELEDDARAQVIKDIEDLDAVDMESMFMHSLRESVYQHSRGKDGKFVESLVILGDTQLQMSGESGDSGYRMPVRDQ